MKKIFGLVMGVMVLAGVAFGDNGWGLIAAYWDTKDANDGYGLGLKVSTEVVPDFMVDFRFTWFEDLGKSAPEIGVTHYKLEVQPIEIGVSIVKEPSDRLMLFGGGGLGYYMMKGEMRTDDRASQRISADPDDEIGFYLNAGFEFIVSRDVESIQATRATLFLEGMYRFVDVKDIAIGDTLDLPVDNGNLNGLGVNLGFMLRW